MFIKNRNIFSLVSLWFLLSHVNFLHAQEHAFGYPGIPSNWNNGKKIQVGTSATKVPIWFTQSTGILNEVYYPSVDTPQIKDAQFVVTDGQSYFADEKQKSLHFVQLLSPVRLRQINEDLGKRFSIDHEYFVFPDDLVLIDEVTVNSYVDGLKYHLLVNTALNGSGLNDSAQAHRDYILFYENKTNLAVSSSVGFKKTSVGYVGYSDGFQDLKAHKRMKYEFKYTRKGNVAGTAQIDIPEKKGRYKFYIIYDFRKYRNFETITIEKQKEKYLAEWDKYLKQRKVPGQLNQEFKKLYLRSLYTLKVHEDKLNAGASVASLSIPWGEKQFDSQGSLVGGYHLVWPRDLFHVSLAQLLSGDKLAAYKALLFLKKIQYKSGVWNFSNQRKIPKKGAFPQNVWTSGKEYWGGFQIDQVGYPVQLFYHLYARSNASERRQLMSEFSEMVKLALNVIYQYGPWSHQERWEENFGISPSSFAVATTALKMGARLFKIRKYEDRANEWLTKPNDNIHTWTFTNSGTYDDGRYYLRVAGCNGYDAKWDPNANVNCFIANSGALKNQKEILDQGFLKLALFGLVDAGDERILTSLQKVNKHVRKIVAKKFIGWHRYSFDAYGENKIGRIWPLLSSEHGRHMLELYQEKRVSWERAKRYVDNILLSYLKFANQGSMIPEQVYVNGEGTGAATPLAWSHAEYIKLLWSRYFRKNVENVFE